MMHSTKLSGAAPVVLRLALSMVFAWFGTSQLLNSGMWTGIVPDWATSFSGLDAGTIVFMNGVFEICAALLLAIGILVRWVALVLAVHLFVIATSFGFSPVGIRDFGLSFATLAVALFGDDCWSFLHRHDHTTPLAQNSTPDVQS